VSEDAVRWDEKYRHQVHRKHLEPDALLIEHQALFLPRQRVIDLASGRGRHSLFLAARGCFVIPLDCSRVALQHCCDRANHQSVSVHPIVADLNDFRLPPACIEAILCFNYLNRSIANNLCEALKPNVILLMKTFNLRYLSINPRFNPTYVLHPGELASQFEKLAFIALDDDCKSTTKPTSSIVAVKR